MEIDRTSNKKLELIVRKTLNNPSPESFKKLARGIEYLYDSGYDMEEWMGIYSEMYLAFYGEEDEGWLKDGKNTRAYLVCNLLFNRTVGKGNRKKLYKRLSEYVNRTLKMKFKIGDKVKSTCEKSRPYTITYKGNGYGVFMGRGRYNKKLITVKWILKNGNERGSLDVDPKYFRLKSGLIQTKVIEKWNLKKEIRLKLLKR